MDLNNPIIRFAHQAVLRASLLVRQVQAELVSPALTKEDLSPVTVADFASQALVAYMLEYAFPDDILVAEENADDLRASPPLLEQVTAFVARLLPQATPADVCRWIDRGASASAPRFWCLDPIDGTKGFLRHDQYAVALALVVDGAVQVGVLGCPELRAARLPAPGGEGSLVIAARDQGAWTTPLDTPGKLVRLHVSDRVDPARARLLRSFESGHTNVGQIDELARALGTQADPVRMDSQAKYAVLAAGEGEVLVRLLSASNPDYREKIWDQAAGSLVLEEAGGRISDLDGKPLDFTTGRSLTNNRGLLATNAHLHSAVLTALQRIGA